MYKSTLRSISRNSTAWRLFALFYKTDSADLMLEVMDLPFRNPVGIAPGFDTEAQLYNAASAAGASFTIIGPLAFTRKGGVRAAVDALQSNPVRNQLIGFDITRNPGSVSEDDIARDYLDAFDYSYDFSDFTVLDFSSKESGPVGDVAFIKEITDPLLEARLAYDSYHPLLLRLGSGIREDELWHILDYCLMGGIDGVMLSEENLIRQASSFSKGRLPIIAESRISKPSRVRDLLDAGASLVAVQTSPAKFKPSLQKAILKFLKKK